MRAGPLVAALVVAACVACTPSATPMPVAPAPATSIEEAGVSAEEELRQATRAGDTARALELIRAGVDVNAKDAHQESAFLLAASERAPDILEATLAAGADLHDKDSWNGTALIRAAERGEPWIVGRLLRAGIERDHVNRIGYQALHEAIWFGRDTDAYADTVRVLVAGGVQLDRPSDNEGLTPLAMAEQRGFATPIATLRRAADSAALAPSASDRALVAAIHQGDADAAALAVRAGADLEHRDAQGRTPLLQAVLLDRVDIIRLLVSLGADPDAVDDRQDTPWLVTGVTGSVAALEALLPGKPDLTLRNRFGGVSIIPAAERGHVDYVRRVVKTGIDVNHVNDLGWTALLEAVILGDGSRRYQDVVRVLLDAGADPNLGDANGVRPVEHARDRGQSDVVRILESAR